MDKDQGSSKQLPALNAVQKTEPEMDTGYDEQFENAYDYDSAFQMTQEQNLLYDLYQPEETPHGTFLCRICLRTGKESEFQDRATFSSHRYKAHGSFNNTVICPVHDCRETFASMAMLRRHLVLTHELPIEVHQKLFVNIGEFERWRHLVEASSQCRFVMHSKQPKHRRQLMHCVCSEHKLILHACKQRLPKVRMHKEGACCPAHISFRIDTKTGQVSVYCQLLHVGHSAMAVDGATPGSVAPNVAKPPIGVHFPVKPQNYAQRPMQYLHVDVVQMTSAVYQASVYEHVLFINDFKTNFFWARPLTEPNKMMLVRLLTDVFCQFGVPDGFACVHSSVLVRETMRVLESIFSVEIREVWNEAPNYDGLEQDLVVMATDELGSAHRWAEILQFAIMELNQKPQNGTKASPFERMFKRKPPNLYDNLDVAVKVEPVYPSDEEENVFEQTTTRKRAPPDCDELASYRAGEKIYLRHPLRRLGRVHNSPYLFGYISEVDPSTPYFPYKVHYSRSEDTWANEGNLFAWVSSYDILPTTHNIKSADEEDRRAMLLKMRCTCSGKKVMGRLGGVVLKNDDISTCTLFRSPLCLNEMSRACCALEGRQKCLYHECYPTYDDSYQRLENTVTAYKRSRKLRPDRVARSQAALERASKGTCITHLTPRNLKTVFSVASAEPEKLVENLEPKKSQVADPLPGTAVAVDDVGPPPKRKRVQNPDKKREGATKEKKKKEAPEKELQRSEKTKEVRKIDGAGLPEPTSSTRPRRVAKAKQFEDFVM